MKMRIIICISNGNNNFLYFSIALNVGFESLPVKGLVFLTAFKKKIFKSSAFCSSCVLTVSSSTKAIFLLDLVLLENKGFTVLQNCLLSTISFTFKFA